MYFPLQSTMTLDSSGASPVPASTWGRETVMLPPCMGTQERFPWDAALPRAYGICAAATSSASIYSATSSQVPGMPELQF